MKRMLLPDQKMFVDKQAFAFFKTLMCHKDIAEKFIKNNRLMYTEEPSGTLWDLSADMVKSVEKIESNGNSRVIHVIKGLYVFSAEERVRLETYIIQSLEPQVFGYISGEFQVYKNKPCSKVFTYTKTIDCEWCSEFGYSLVSGNKQGSIFRMC